MLRARILLFYSLVGSSVVGRICYFLILLLVDNRAFKFSLYCVLIFFSVFISFLSRENVFLSLSLVLFNVNKTQNQIKSTQEKKQQ